MHPFGQNTRDEAPIACAIGLHGPQHGHPVAHGHLRIGFCGARKGDLGVTGAEVTRNARVIRNRRDHRSGRRRQVHSEIDARGRHALIAGEIKAGGRKHMRALGNAGHGHLPHARIHQRRRDLDTILVDDDRPCPGHSRAGQGRPGLCADAVIGVQPVVIGETGNHRGRRRQSIDLHHKAAGRHALVACRIRRPRKESVEPVSDHAAGSRRPVARAVCHARRDDGRTEIDIHRRACFRGAGENKRVVGRAEVRRARIVCIPRNHGGGRGRRIHGHAEGRRCSAFIARRIHSHRRKGMRALAQPVGGKRPGRADRRHPADFHAVVIDNDLARIRSIGARQGHIPEARDAVAIGSGIRREARDDRSCCRNRIDRDRVARRCSARVPHIVGGPGCKHVAAGAERCGSEAPVAAAIGGGCPDGHPVAEDLDGGARHRRAAEGRRRVIGDGIAGRARIVAEAGDCRCGRCRRINHDDLRTGIAALKARCIRRLDGEHMRALRQHACRKAPVARAIGLRGAQHRRPDTHCHQRIGFRRARKRDVRVTGAEVARKARIIRNGGNRRHGRRRAVDGEGHARAGRPLIAGEIHARRGEHMRAFGNASHGHLPHACIHQCRRHFDTILIDDDRARPGHSRAGQCRPVERTDAVIGVEPVIIGEAGDRRCCGRNRIDLHHIAAGGHALVARRIRYPREEGVEPVSDHAAGSRRPVARAVSHARRDDGRTKIDIHRRARFGGA